jgi:hypothetical protein
MKKVKEAPEFYYKDISKESIKDMLNSNFQLNLKDLSLIVDRVHDKYPYIGKPEISLIVKSTFESIRDFLVLGYVINFNKFLFDMKLHFYQFRDRVGVRVRAKTPPRLKKGLHV